MNRTRRCRTILPVFLLLGTSCGSPQNQTPEKTSTKTPATNPLAIPTSGATQDSKRPRKFGFDIVSAEKDNVTNSIRVEGVSPDNWRFVLSCPTRNEIAGLPDLTLSEFRKARDESHVASTDSDFFIIYSMDSEAIIHGKGQDPWGKEFARCLIINRVERAADVFLIRVYSSEFGNWRGAPRPGYQIRAQSATESFRLVCTEGGTADSQCVSMKPEAYRAIRDGSELRLCDADLNVIGRYRITSEQATR